MSIFSQRTYGYKAGVCLLLVGTVVVIAGFASPNWMECNVTFKAYPQHDSPFSEARPLLPVLTRRHAHAGLWKGCMQHGTSSSSSLCEAFHNVPNWLLGVRGLQCLALLGLLLSCAQALAVNWLIRSPPHNRLLEIVAAISGVAGFAGVIVFMVETSKLDLNKLFESPKGNVEEEEEQDMESELTVFCHVSWAFAIDVCACVMTFLAAIVIGLNNLPLQAQVNPQRATPTPRPTNNHVSQAHAQGTSPNAITILPPQLGTPPTNLQVFYVPHANFTSAAHPAMDFRPPAYDAHSPTPLPISQPPMACPAALGSVQPLPYSPGQQEPAVSDPALAAASAASALPPAPPSFPPEEKKVMPQEPGV